MKVYSIDVKVWATAYIKADSPEEALEKLNAQLTGQAIEVSRHEGAPFSAAGLDSAELPEVSLSPAMTVAGPEVGETPMEV